MVSERDAAIGGWGLVLVDRMSDRWGVKHAANGLCAPNHQAP